MTAHRFLLTIVLIVLCGIAMAEDFDWSGSADSEDWYAFNPVITDPPTHPILWLNNWGEIIEQHVGQDPPGHGSWDWPSGPDTANIGMEGAELLTASAALSSVNVGLGGSLWIREALQVTTLNIAGLVEVGAYADLTGCAIQNDGGTGILRSEFFNNLVVPDPVLHDVIISVPVEIPDTKGLALLGTVHLNDVIQVLGTGGGAELIIDGDTTLSGNGWVETSDNIANRISGNQYYGQVFTNQTTIHAAGYLGWGNLFTTNQGLIVADRATMLIVDPPPGVADGHPGFINTSTLRAAGGGTMRLQGGAFDNTGGVIEALDASVVEIHDHSLVTGGNLKTIGSGEIHAIGNNPRVSDLTLDAGSVLAIPDGKHLHPEGTLTIDGELRLQSAGAGSTLVVRSPVFLAGAGEVVLSDSEGNAFSFAGFSGDHRLTSSIPIRGATGSVFGLAHGIAITNHSTITADGVNPLLINPSTAPLDGQAGVVNTGTLRAVNGATLELEGGDFDNTGGIIKAQDGSTVALGVGLRVSGGQLHTGGTGILRSTTGFDPPSLADLSINGRIEVPVGTILRLGGSVINNGLVEVGDQIMPVGDLVLLGSGEVDFIGSGQILPNGDSVTNGPDHTIRASGTTMNYIGHPLVHDGVLVVESGASLRLNQGANARVGSSTRVDGTLQTLGTLTMAGQLSGIGAVSGAVNLTGTGTLAPGSSTGTLTTGNMVIEDGATFHWQTSDVTGSDLVDINGALDMGVASLTVTISVLAGDIPDRVVLFAYNTLASTPDASQFVLTNGYTFTGVDTSNNELALTGVDRPGLVFADGFETGDVDGWSSAQGSILKSLRFDPATDSMTLRVWTPERSTERYGQFVLVDGRDFEGEPLFSVVSRAGALRAGVRCTDGWHWSSVHVPAGSRLELQWRPGEVWLYGARGLIADVVGLADGEPLALVQVHSTQDVRVEPKPAESR